MSWKNNSPNAFKKKCTLYLIKIILIISRMEPAVLLITLACGFVMSRFGFPPMVGYLGAGFILYTLEIDENTLPLLEKIADIGVYLLLFAIGLRLDLKSLIKPEVLVTSGVHMFSFVIISLSILKVFAVLGFSQIEGLSENQLLLLAFAFSFSSTVFAVKTLDDKGEMVSLYGQIAIGILIIQDLFAVVFLTFSKGELPSIYAFALLLLPFLRPLIHAIFDRVGHGDLLVLFGLVMTLVFGAFLFEKAGLKPDLGALVMGILLSGHTKTQELTKSIFYFKELFLVTFFLTIGLKGLPTAEDLVLAVLLTLVLPIKWLIFLTILTRFRIRARTAFLSSSALMTYSEFGLIVCSVASLNGWLPKQLIIVLAVSLALSFLFASPLNQLSEQMYQYLHPFLAFIEHNKAKSEDTPIRIGHPRFLILGMGRIGTGAYDALKKNFGNVVVGIEHKPELVARHHRQKRRVILGDASDTDFWHKLEPNENIEHILLTMSRHHGNLLAFEQLKGSSYEGKVSAIALYQEEISHLSKMKINHVYDIYESAGVGFVNSMISEIQRNKPPTKKKTLLKKYYSRKKVKKRKED
jgi:predicted Kef-type K+ transport protein